MGADFEQRVFNSSRDAIMLIYHPLSQKNRGLKQRFDRFADLEQTNGNSALQFFRYNGLNESEVFKTPSKLPAIIYFRRTEKDGEFVKESVVFENVREHMLLDSTDERFAAAMADFIA